MINTATTKIKTKTGKLEYIRVDECLDALYVGHESAHIDNIALVPVEKLIKRTKV